MTIPALLLNYIPASAEDKPDNEISELDLTGVWNTFDSCFSSTAYTLIITQEGRRISLAPTVGNYPSCNGTLTGTGLNLSCIEGPGPADSCEMTADVLDNASFTLSRVPANCGSTACAFTRHTGLDPIVKEMLKRVNFAESILPLGQRSPWQMRGYMLRSCFWSWLMPCAPVAAIHRTFIPGPNGFIPAQIYVPEGKGPFPIVVFYHGGGWVVGSSLEFDHFSRQLADGASVMVISVDYRLAPEHVFPAAHEDAYAALEWAAENAGRFGGDPARLAVAGESAGANLAIAVSIRARDSGGPEILHQTLMCPITNVATMNTASYHDYAAGYMLTREWMEAFRSYYLPDCGDWSDPRVSPLLLEDSAELPPALVITGDFDVLRDEGETFARQLFAAGVAVRHYRGGGVIHGFTTALIDYLDQSRNAVSLISAELRQVFE